MTKVETARLVEEQVEVELLSQVFIKAQALAKKRNAFDRQVVGPDDGGVAAAGAAANVALIEHRNIGDTALREVIRGGQSMDSGADYDNVVLVLEIVG